MEREVSASPEKKIDGNGKLFFLMVQDLSAREETQTLTSCQMLPVTVTGSAFDRKIVSVLPVPFCQVLVSLWSRARNKKPRTRVGDE